MTLAEIAVKVARELDDLGAGFYEVEADIKPSVQDGYNLITALTECRETNASVNFSADTVYYDFSSVLTNYLRIFGIYNNTTKRWMEPVSFIEALKIRTDWECMVGDPYYFIPVSYKTVAIFPSHPTAIGSMTILYKATANTLTDGLTPDVPIEQQESLENYSIDDLLDQAQEWSKAMDYAKAWDLSIDEIRRVLRNRSQPNQIYYKHPKL